MTAPFIRPRTTVQDQMHSAFLLMLALRSRVGAAMDDATFSELTAMVVVMAVPEGRLRRHLRRSRRAAKH